MLLLEKKRCIDVRLIVALGVALGRGQLVSVSEGRGAVNLEPVEARGSQEELVADEALGLDTAVCRGCRELGIVFRVLLVFGLGQQQVP